MYVWLCLWLNLNLLVSVTLYYSSAVQVRTPLRYPGQSDILQPEAPCTADLLMTHSLDQPYKAMHYEGINYCSHRN